MSHATRPGGRKPTMPSGVPIWRCGYCNTRCKTVLAPGGLCALCRSQQPPLIGPEDMAPSRERGGDGDA